jgi:hypothetical protein
MGSFARRVLPNELIPFCTLTFLLCSRSDNLALRQQVNPWMKRTLKFSEIPLTSRLRLGKNFSKTPNFCLILIGSQRTSVLKPRTKLRPKFIRDLYAKAATMGVGLRGGFFGAFEK